LADSVDIHQHLWTERLVEALARRDSFPFARPANGRFVLYAEGEAPATVEAGANAVESRLTDLDRDGIHRAVVSLSGPIGVESLPRREAEPLLEAYEAGVTELPSRFAAWGAIALEKAGPDDVDRVLDAGFVGVSLPAGALATPRAVARLAPALERLEQRSAPLFVHPGPGLARDREPFAERDPSAPAWWPALTRYLFEMQSAWLAFLTEGRAAHPDLPVVFAMLAGCAPLHRERLAGRGGPAWKTADPLFFYDCSSYGTQALDAMVRCVGVEQIVFGSDRPVVEPTSCHLGDAARYAIEVTNPARAMNGLGVAA
jgi:predicted TIM-barrel fold metal-dependent hydrolase